MTHKTHIFMLDDETHILQAVRINVDDDDRYAFHGYGNPDEFVAAVVDHGDVAILIVDHDLNQGTARQGMDVTREVRVKHPFGLVLPVIYYSARLSGSADYLVRASDRKYLLFSPTVYVAKAGSMNSDAPTDLFAVIESAAEMLGQVAAISARQAVEQALYSPGAGDGFSFDEDDYGNLGHSERDVVE